MQPIPRLLANLLVILVKILVHLLVKLTKLGLPEPSADLKFDRGPELTGPGPGTRDSTDPHRALVARQT